VVFRRVQLWLTLKKLQEKVSQWFIVVSGVLNNISKVHQNLITENVKISRWPPPVFLMIEKIIILSDLIDIHDQPSRVHRSPPRSRQNFQNRKIQRFDKSDTDISDLMIKCFDRDKSYQK